MTIKLTFEFETREEVLQFLGAKPVTAAQATAAAAPAAPSSSEPATAPAGDDKDALVERAKELGIDATKRWGVPKLEAAIAEAEKKSEAPAEEEDPFSLDDDGDKQPEYTKEDVRGALVKYQTALKASLIEGGKSEDEAKSEAMNTARALLKDKGDADTLGGLEDSKFAAVVKAAEAATAAL